MSKKKDLLLYLLFLAYIVAAVFVYISLPFLVAAAVDGALTAVFFVLGIFLCREEAEEEGAWGYIKKSRKRIK